MTLAPKPTEAPTITPAPSTATTVAPTMAPTFAPTSPFGDWECQDDFFLGAFCAGMCMCVYQVYICVTGSVYGLHRYSVYNPNPSPYTSYPLSNPFLTPNAPSNPSYLPVVFAQQGCCYANQISIVEQTPTSNTSYVVLPPCVARYLTLQCPVISLSDSFCVNGTNSNTSIVSGYVTSAATPITLPDMYVKNSVLNLQGVIAATLAANTGAGFQVMNALNIEISNYEYYNSTGQMISSAVGLPDVNLTDYTDAVSGKFFFNVVQVYGSVSVGASNEAFINSPYFSGGIATGYGLDSSLVTAAATTNNFYVAERFDTTHSGSSGSPLSLHSSIITIGVLGLTMVATVYLV